MERIHAQMYFNGNDGKQNSIGWFHDITVNRLIEEVCNGGNTIPQGEEITVTHKQIVKVAQKYVAMPTEKEYQLILLTKAIAKQKELFYKMESRLEVKDDDVE